MQPSVPVRRRAVPAALLLMLSGLPGLVPAAEPDLAAIERTVAEQHNASLKRLRDWIALPSIAAEDRNATEGCATTRPSH